MSISCLIVDDEQPVIDELSYILSQIEGIEIVGTASNATKAITDISVAGG